MERRGKKNRCFINVNRIAPSFIRFRNRVQKQGKHTFRLVFPLFLGWILSHSKKMS